MIDNQSSSKGSWTSIQVSGDSTPHLQLYHSTTIRFGIECLVHDSSEGEIRKRIEMNAGGGV